MNAIEKPNYTKPISSNQTEQCLLHKLAEIIFTQFMRRLNRRDEEKSIGRDKKVWESKRLRRELHFMQVDLSVEANLLVSLD